MSFFSSFRLVLGYLLIYFGFSTEVIFLISFYKNWDVSKENITISTWLLRFILVTIPLVMFGGGIYLINLIGCGEI